MEGRISRLDHNQRRFSAPPESFTQTKEDHRSIYSSSESFGRRIPIQTRTTVSPRHRGALPLRSALKRPCESRHSPASSSRRTSGSDAGSTYFEQSSSYNMSQNQANIGNSERPSRFDALIEFADTALRQDAETSAPVHPSFLAPNEFPIRTPISRKQSRVTVLISRLRTGRRRSNSAPSPPPSQVVAPPSQPPLLSQCPCYDILEDVPTIDIRNCTPSDSDPDTPPSTNLAGSPEPLVRKTVRFAIWSHMRTFERPEWEPTGDAYEEATYNGSSYHGFPRKVWVFDHLNEK